MMMMMMMTTMIQDIFATNVIARDPYSDRFVELIDSDGCPVDPYVFPALGLSRSIISTIHTSSYLFLYITFKSTSVTGLTTGWRPISMLSRSLSRTSLCSRPR